VAPLDRISLQLDTTALRLEIKSPGIGGSTTAGLSADDSPAAHLRKGRQEISAGRVDAAESEFRAALATDPTSPAAHSWLAEIYRRRGKLDDAVKELQTSLQTRDSAVVRTTLARIYLEQKKTDLARAETERALKLAPNYSEAKQLLEHLQKQKPSGGPQ
jgi:predicted Zn-dependent protease